MPKSSTQTNDPAAAKPAGDVSSSPPAPEPGGPTTRPNPATASGPEILVLLSLCHMLNDIIQALLPAIYPILKESFSLTFTQIGLITFTFMTVGSVLQPVVGFMTDRRPRPASLVFGMSITLVGLVLLAFAPIYGAVIGAAALIGLGSAIFHPESSRIARLASGGRHGFAQSLFQVGGNAGTALGPLLAAWIIVPFGQRHILWFSAVAMAGMWILNRVSRWYRVQLASTPRVHRGAAERNFVLGRRQTAVSLGVLLVLMFSKFFYLSSMTNYYTFFVIERFGLTVPASQMFLFAFLVSGAIGTLVGGAAGDRLGRNQILWISVLGVAPFSLLLPHANMFGTVILSMIVGFLMASAFPAILVYATELLPGRVGLIAGLFFGMAFGLAGIGSAVLGKLADATSIGFVIQACGFLPLLGLLTWFLPKLPDPASRR